MGPEAPAKSATQRKFKPGERLHDNPVSHEGMKFRAPDQLSVRRVFERVRGHLGRISGPSAHRGRSSIRISAGIVVNNKHPVSPRACLEQLVRDFNLGSENSTAVFYTWIQRQY